MTGEAVKIGVVGMGNMGSVHARHILDLPHTTLAAVCDTRPQRLELAPDIPRFQDFRALLELPGLDAVLIATPHTSHPSISLAAFERGIHVLVEKPIAVQVRSAQRMIDGYRAARQQHPQLVFSAMFMQRTWGHWRRIKALLERGALGRLQRATWLITDWFRTQHYYDSGGWRATWRGEGGGVLMNQCPHNLDLYQWLLGMPRQVHGFVHYGKHHSIEVEDEVSAYFLHDDGMIGHFITSTGESPGTNRLEIVGEYGKLVYETAALSESADPADPDARHKSAAEAAGSLIFYRNERSSREDIRQSQRGFDKVPFQREAIALPAMSSHGHELIIANFAEAIRQGQNLIAPAVEGIHSLLLSNAIILSAHKRATIDLPLDGEAYAALLQAYIGQPPAQYSQLGQQQDM